MIRRRQGLVIAYLVFCSGVACAQSEISEGTWSIVVSDDPASYQSFVLLQQEAMDTIKDEYATSNVIPVLEFRCTPGNAEITPVIDWRRFISSFNTEVGFRVDGGKMLWQKWGVDQSNKVTASKSVADSQSIVEHLRGGRNLEVEVTPYSESPVTVRFDLAGLSSGLDTLQKECQKTSDSFK